MVTKRPMPELKAARNASQRALTRNAPVRDRRDPSSASDAHHGDDDGVPNEPGTERGSRRLRATLRSGGAAAARVAGLEPRGPSRASSCPGGRAVSATLLFSTHDREREPSGGA